MNVHRVQGPFLGRSFDHFCIHQAAGAKPQGPGSFVQTVWGIRLPSAVPRSQRNSPAEIAEPGRAPLTPEFQPAGGEAAQLRPAGRTPFFRQIPWELEQAAQVDGATTWQAFLKAIVPLAAPGVFTTALISFFIAWNDFIYGISLTSSDAARPVPAALAFFTGASQFEEPTGAISAAAVVVTAPVVVLVVLFQRQIVFGVTQGAVKG